MDSWRLGETRLQLPPVPVKRTATPWSCNKNWDFQKVWSTQCSTKTPIKLWMFNTFVLTFLDLLRIHSLSQTNSSKNTRCVEGGNRWVLTCEGKLDLTWIEATTKAMDRPETFSFERWFGGSDHQWFESGNKNHSCLEQGNCWSCSPPKFLPRNAKKTFSTSFPSSQGLGWHLKPWPKSSMPFLVFSLSSPICPEDIAVPLPPSEAKDPRLQAGGLNTVKLSADHSAEAKWLIGRHHALPDCGSTEVHGSLLFLARTNDIVESLILQWFQHRSVSSAQVLCGTPERPCCSGLEPNMTSTTDLGFG